MAHNTSTGPISGFLGPLVRTILAQQGDPTAALHAILLSLQAPNIGLSAVTSSVCCIVDGQAYSRSCSADLVATSVSFQTHDSNVVHVFTDGSTVITPVVGQHNPRTGSIHFLRKDTGTAFRLGLCSIARDLSITTDTAA